MATRIPKTIDGWNSRQTLEVLADFESHEGDRIKVVSGWEKRVYFQTVNVRDADGDRFQMEAPVRQPYFSTKIYVNRQLTAEYNSTDLPDDWLLFVGIELQQLARDRAGAEEVIGLIDYIIPRLSERHDREREAAELSRRAADGGLETIYDFWDYFVPLKPDKTKKVS